MSKTLGILFWLALACVVCPGQSSFQGITPGASTSRDVERALGQPVRAISPTLFEHRPPAGIAKIEVEYGEGSAFVERVEVSLQQPVTRRALAAKFNLPQRADEMKIDGEGRLVEYLGGTALVVFTYADREAASGVVSIGHYSRELYERRLRRLRGAVDIPLLNANIISVRFLNAGLELPPPNQMQYKNRFSKSEARAIYWELFLEHPDPGRTISFNVDALLYGPGGGVTGQTRFDRRIERYWRQTPLYGGFGWQEPGKWEVGTYRVEIFIEGQKVATGSFEIY